MHVQVGVQKLRVQKKAGFTCCWTVWNTQSLVMSKIFTSSSMWCRQSKEMLPLSQAANKKDVHNKHQRCCFCFRLLEPDGHLCWLFIIYCCLKWMMNWTKLLEKRKQLKIHQRNHAIQVEIVFLAPPWPQMTFHGNRCFWGLTKTAPRTTPHNWQAPGGFLEWWDFSKDDAWHGRENLGGSTNICGGNWWRVETERSESLETGQSFARSGVHEEVPL